MTTRKKIEELAIDNPLVRFGVSEYRQGLIGWEDMLMELVTSLVTANNQMQKLLEKKYSGRGFCINHQVFYDVQLGCPSCPHP